ncbi:hypothetical protein [Roseiarcus sp.]|uniref:hypothetical protein n=1 Tax=Roseiarcus sp. TaxID=1969460 RepID=UPI003C3B9806
MRGFAKAIWVAVGLLAGAPGFAADLPTKKPAPAPVPVPAIPSTWHYELTGYGWGLSLAGSAGFGTLATQEYYAPFSKVLEHLEAVFMGSVVARNDMFIVGLDLIGSRVGGSGTVSVRNAPLGTDLTLTEGIVTAFGGLRIPIGLPNLDLYGTVGARYMYNGTKLTVSGPFGLLSVDQSVNKDWVDPVAGFAAHYRFDDRWYMNVLGDLGGWSDSATGQALASVGYNWTQNWSTTLGYRVLYSYEKQDTGVNYVTFEPKSFRYQQWLYGPFAGLKYSF